MDDRTENLLALESILGEAGMVLVRATSGEEALRELLGTDFAVILLDVRMPGMSGFEVATLVRARERTRHTPIIFLTAGDRETFTVEDAYSLGAVDYLAKPISPVVLRAKVAVFVELYRRTREARATERRRAEVLLREKDERLQLLIDGTRDYAVVITDRAGAIVEWAGGAEGITGFPPAEAVGRPVAFFFTAEDRADGVPEREREVAGREGRAEDKRWHRRKDGTQFFADGVMVPLRGGDGDLRGFGKVFRDATARKRAEVTVRFLADASASLAELVDHESTLRGIADSAVVGFADWCVVDVLDVADDADTRRQLAVAAARADGGSAGQAAVATFGLDDGPARVVSRVLRAGRTDAAFDLGDVPPAAASGPDRFAGLRAWGVRSYLCVPMLARGRVLGALTFLSSSSRRRFGPDEQRMAENLAGRAAVAVENARLYRTLQEQDRRKDEFLATLAHELRNPLAPIRNAVEIFRMERGNREDRPLAMMDRQLNHLTRMVDDLLDVSRVSTGKVVLKKERVEVREVTDAAVETSAPVISGGGHTLDVRLPDGPLVLNADRTRLVQIVSNLLNNAAKYTPPGGLITLSAGADGSEVVVRVADSGVGIPAEMLPKVFDLFTQVGTSLERSQGGLGIGLTLVRRLVELHDGTVTADSPGGGRGSTFTVRLPLAADTDPSTGTPTPAAVGPGVGPPLTLSLLIVDDNRDAAESLAMILEMYGHHVRTAHDGAEAVRILADYRPHMILLDLGLPGMSGFDVARQIRGMPALRDVRLVALTGWGQEDDRRRTREAGFDHHLVKPASTADLERLVDQFRAG